MCVLVPNGHRLCDPFAQRIQEFAINQVGHVHSPHGQVVFDVVDFVKEAPAVGLLDARGPAFIPGCCGIL